MVSMTQVRRMKQSNRKIEIHDLTNMSVRIVRSKEIDTLENPERSACESLLHHNSTITMGKIIVRFKKGESM